MGGGAVSASDDKTLKVWDVETGRELSTLRGHSVLSLAWRSVWMAACGLRFVDKTLKVWDVETDGNSAPWKATADLVNWRGGECGMGGVRSPLRMTKR